MYLAQGHNTVPPVRLEPVTNRPRVRHFICRYNHHARILKVSSVEGGGGGGGPALTTFLVINVLRGWGYQ